MAAQSQALFSFGLFAVAGELCTLVASSLALPAAVALLDRRQRGAQHTERS
jgi:hypothetical protein